MKLRKALLSLFLIVFVIPSEAKLKIGFIEGFTGSDPNTAKELFRGVEVFLKSSSAAGLELEVIRLDTAGTISGTIEAMNRGYERGVRVFIGPGKSDAAIAAAKVARQKNALLITPFATNSEITKNNPNAFRICFSDIDQGKALARFALTRLKPKKVSILRNIESKYSTGLSDVFLEELTKQMSKSRIQEITYSTSELDASKTTAAIGVFAPDLIFIPDHITSAALLAKMITKDLGSIQILGADGFGGKKMFLSVMGEERKTRLIYSTHWQEDIANQESQTFIRFYKELFPYDAPSSGAAMSYDSVGTVYSAWVGSGRPTDINKLIRRLESKSFPSTVGKISFPDPTDHSPTKPIIFMEFKNGIYSFREAVR